MLVDHNKESRDPITACELIPEYVRGMAGYNFLTLKRKYPDLKTLFPSQSHSELFKFLFTVAATAEGIMKVTNENPGSKRANYFDAPVNYYTSNLEVFVDYQSFGSQEFKLNDSQESYFRQALWIYLSEMDTHKDSKKHISSALSLEEKAQVSAYTTGIWILTKMKADEIFLRKNYELATVIGHISIDLAVDVLEGKMPA